MELSDFLLSIREGERNIPQLIGLENSAFTEMPFNELLTRSDDLLSGVNRVLTYNRNALLFDIFKAFCIKYLDDKGISYQFQMPYATTQTTQLLFELIKEVFGEGKTDDISHAFSKISISDKCCNLWMLDNASIFLLYFNSTKILSLSISVHPKIEIDTSVRNKGTIFDFIKTDLNSLIEKSKIGSQTSPVLYKLSPPEFSIFNHLNVFVSNNTYSDGYSRLTFHGTSEIKYELKVPFIEKIIKIYGSDSMGYGELTGLDLDMLSKNEFWTGRKWSFNKENALEEFQNDSLLYTVEIADYKDEEGFRLEISGPDYLINLL